MVGAAIARDLAGTKHSVVILESCEDVVEGTSKANTAILHTGFDATPGTLESRLVAEGYHLAMEYARAAGVGVKRTGAIVVAWDQEERDALPSMQAKAERNGYRKARIISAQQVYDELPHLGKGAVAGMIVQDEAIIDAWSLPLALATEAVNRGADLLLRHQVNGVDVGPEHTVLYTSAGDVTARWVVNAAGLGSDIIDRHFGYDRFHLHPRKGELCVFDKLSARLVDKIVLAIPSSKGKGVLVTPTVFGNVLLGPTAHDGDDRADTSTTEDGFAFLLRKGARIFPNLLKEEITATYAGLRAAHDLDDYLLHVDAGQRYVIAAGIRSTGLTSAMAVSRYLIGELEQAGLGLGIRPGLPPPPKMPPLSEFQRRPHRDNALIESDPAYGEIVCFCERVTRGEIRDALRSPIPPATLSGLRRRTRAMNGRCQGFYCAAQVTAQFERYSGSH